MPDRWVRLCRRLAPPALREAVFDPTIADLEHDHAVRSAAHAGRRRRATGRARLALAVLSTALECRRLDQRPTSPPRFPGGHGDPMLITWLSDVRHAFRQLWRQPLFVLVAVATLALGIGANVAAFSFVNALLLSPARATAPQQLVRVYGRTREFRYDVTSYPNYADARDGASGLDLAVHVITPVLVGDGEASESRPLELVSGNYFRVLQLAPVVGRLLDARDDGAEGAHAVAAIGEALWRAKYRGDPAIVGQSIRLNGMSYEIVGVVPRPFQGSGGVYPAEIWAPIAMQQQLRPRGLDLTRRGWGWLSMIGRVAPGETLAGVQPALDRAAADITRRFPNRGPLTLVAVPAMALPEADRQALAPYLRMTLAFTALLLLVTCANLGGVMQARVVARRRELAIRQSLGAGRGRLTSEWLTESLILTGAGALMGLLVARLTILAILHYRPPAQLTGEIVVGAPIDGPVIAFAAGVSIVAALLFGLLPALRAASAQPLSLLKEEVATTTGGRRGVRLRRGAVLVQVATSAVLLLVSGLLVASLGNMRSFDTGFRTDHLAMVSVDLKFQRVPEAQARPYATALLERLRVMPGISSAALAVSVPLGSGHDAYGYQIPGYTPPDGKKTVPIDTNVVSAGYFETMGLSFVRGGAWDAAASSTPTAVINETMAKRFWPGQDPVGRALELVDRGTLSIAGVVRDSAYYTVGEDPMPFVYLPAEVGNPLEYTVLARTAQPAGDVLPALSRAVTATDARVRPLSPITFEDSRHALLYPRRMLATVASVFGFLALFLTSLGLYGVVSASVGQRTREIGVRMALGARSSVIQAGVLRESATLVAAGAVIGLGVGYAAAGALRQFLFGVAPFDSAIYAVVAGLLAALAVLAAWAPARRASRVDPAVVLRS